MNLEISTERLDTDINKLQENLDNLRAAKDQVYRCLEQLNTMWDGIAKMTFQAQTIMDEQVLAGLLANLDNLIACMEYAKSEYNRCNEDVNSKINSIRLSGGS